MGRLVVGLGEPGGFALGGTVQGQLDATDAKMVMVLRCAVHVVVERRHHQFVHTLVENIRVGHDIRFQHAGLGSAHGHLHVLRRAAAILQGGIAKAGVQPLAFLEHGHGLLAIHFREQLSQCHKEGIFFQQARRLAGFRVFNDDAAGRVGAVGGDADFFQRGAVEHTKVGALVHDQYRRIGTDLIQLCAAGVTLLRQLGIVVTETINDAELLVQFRGFGEGLQAIHQLRHTADATIRRRQQVGAHGLKTDKGHMAMGIHKTGQQRLALQIVHGGAVPLITQHRVFFTHRHNAPIAHRNSPGLGGVIIDGYHRAIEPDGFGRRRRWQIGLTPEQGGYCQSTRQPLAD